ncbi:hypothetical protein [Amphiplicatus metriothermophilus]|uniref:Uncharacterized protein n=1 Tax=Amphiplicatus metriothermophilus TaxID=1519374 RepID=A0A239Q0Y4_9PROT|nr:hypothetical protein [Amphiplicatus metriothermophilus]MBB5520069.1 hypothetical protein [Amphiplicatus metriothermophilus]SNT75862.1 hypothetical protein SAMN06297382_2941 [Amphiplicatus metriothermophilus]
MTVRPVVKEAGRAAALAQAATAAAAVIILALILSSRALGLDMPNWLGEWRTGALFAASAVLIVSFQVFFQQYIEARAVKRGLLDRLHEEQAQADALLARLEGRTAEEHATARAGAGASARAGFSQESGD